MQEVITEEVKEIILANEKTMTSKQIVELLMDEGIEDIETSHIQVFKRHRGLTSDCDVPRPCVICGKMFTPGSARRLAITCSQECCSVKKREDNRQRQHERQARLVGIRSYGDDSWTRTKKKKTESTIPELSAEAKAAGMNYGEYVSRKYMQERTVKRHIPKGYHTVEEWKKIRGEK